MSFIVKRILPKSLHTALEQLQTDMHNIENLNLGGCGVFAMYVCKELKNLGIDAEVVTATHEGCSPSVVEYRMKANNLKKKHRKSAYYWDLNGLDRSHIGVRFKWGLHTFTYDSNAIRYARKTFGIINGNHGWKCDYPFGQGMSPKQIKPLVQDSEYWNDSFDRKQIPLVKKLIKQRFKSIELDCQ